MSAPTCDDGGPAYPGALTWRGNPGMSLRDFFAGQAMQGAAASNVIYASCEQAAGDAYAMADAMLRERLK